MRIRWILLTLFVAALFVLPASGLLTGYSYRQKHNVTGNTSWTANLTNYQVMFTVNTSSGTSSNGLIYLNSHSTPAAQPLDDLRFTDLSDNYWEYWIEETTNTSTQYTVWVEVPSIYNSTTATQMYVYYGNSSSSTYSNGYNTFLFFDNFPGAAFNTTNWDRYGAGGSVVVSGGIVTITAPAGGADGLESDNAYGTNPIASRNYMKMTEGNYNEVGMGELSTITREGIVYDAGKYTYGRISGPGYTKVARATDLSGAYHIVDMWGVSSTNFTVVIDGTKDGVVTTNIPTSSLGYYMGANTNQKIYSDWVFMRKYNSIEPIHSTWFSEEELCSAPVTAFSGNTTSGYPPFYIQFTDASTNSPTAWNWTFEDGGYSSTQNATHWYNVTIGNSATCYDVSLNSSQTCGFDWENKTNYVCAYPLNASFSASATTGDSSTVFTFSDLTNNGTPSAWNWSFGDGSYSELQNPTHSYSTFGRYNVSLNSSNIYSYDWENKTNYIEIFNTTVSQFIGTPTCGNATLTVYFADFSTGDNISSWNWVFGDGNTSTSRNIIHNYTYNGNFTVNLTVVGDGGSDIESKYQYIQVPCNVTPTPTPTPTATATSAGGVSAPVVMSANSASVSELSYPIIILVIGALSFAGLIGIIIMGRR